ncbi:MAG: mannose-1-phosphate guanylyltransferase/mannose-6-phosphate isomerase [Rugosibacter sp.]
MDLLPLILCGGSGSRLWPLSREQHPKQLLALTGKDSLLQITAARIPASFPLGQEGRVLPPMVVSNEHYRFITAEQLRQAGITSAALILEPAGRNTAPALTLAALAAAEHGGDPLLLVMPADHIIADTPMFQRAVALAMTHAAAGRLVTFGVAPTRAETGYGYIGVGEQHGDDGAHLIARFVEKPDQATAERYLAAGGHVWNSGIFMMRASVWLERIGRYRVDILSACTAAFAGRRADSDFIRVDAAAFLDCPAESIDYAVMEKLPRGEGVVIPLQAQWSDIGSWDALWQIADKDGDGNLLSGDVVALDSRSTLAISQSRLLACVGVDNLVVVETPDAVLVAHKDSVQRVKDIVAKLKREKRSEGDAHRKIHRPWGYYDSIDSGSRFQVKRLVVNPGATLSQQMHHHRAEHWVVVRGTARVTCGEKIYLLAENESTYIPLGHTHRLENPGRIPLEIIEVQSGAYLGEDDIVRFEDKYGRN